VALEAILRLSFGTHSSENSGVLLIYSVWILGSALGLLLLARKQISFVRQLSLLAEVPVTERLTWPKISLIIPACNEETTIEPALRSLLSHTYPQLELIVINDRSTDRTGDIIADLCANKPNARVVTVTSLPKGWIGKVHAQHKGVQHATGDWILFSDADVHLGNDTLKKAITYCEKNDVQFLTLVPHIIASGFWIQLCIAQFLSSGALAIDLLKIRDSKRKEAIGCGAFNLVKTSAYKKTRGLEWLKMEVIDDGGFGFMMKNSGANCDLVSGLNEVKIEWYTSVGSYIRGLEKNAFSIFQYNIYILSVFTLFIGHWLLGLYLIPFLHPQFWSLIVLALSFLVYQIANYKMLKKSSGFPRYVIIFLPLAKLFSLITVWRGAILCLYRGGIYWRQTFYKIHDLKQSQRLKLMNFIFLKKYD
jgi:cellulose synthase/poly-beta-1,6-N-acetylglucosamine synthase-like glycosyltransferase